MFKIALTVSLFALGAMVFVSCQSRNRQSALEHAAEKLGLRYLGNASEELAAEWKRLPSISIRPQNFFTNTIAGDNFFVFDWTSRAGKLKKRDRNVQTVIAFRRSDLNLPAFVWGHHGELPMALQRVMQSRVDFPDQPSFGDHYDLVASNPEAIRNIFTTTRRADLDLPSHFQVEGRGDWIVLFEPGKLVEASQLSRLFEIAKPIANTLAEEN